MVDILAEPLVPSTDASESAVGDETVILHLGSGIYFGLDALGTRIWTQLKQGIAPGEICKVVANEFTMPLELVEADARQFLADLVTNGILVRG